MSENTMRKAFEAQLTLAANAEGYSKPDFKVRSDGKYYEFSTHLAWLGWQAAIAYQNPINDSQTQHWELDKNNLCFKGSVVDTEAKQSQEVKDALKEAAKIVDARADNWDLFIKNTEIAVELRIASKGIRALIK